MEPLELGKYIVQIFQKIYARLSFVTECSKGYGIIKKRFGQPIKWRNKPSLYWKWPIIDTFDEVDMRKRYLQVNAHSFHSPDMKETIIPYNIIIDVQVEYEVINPLVIYNEYGFKEGEEAYTSYVNNVVQEIISEIIFEYGIDLDYIKLNSSLKNKTIHTIRKRLNEEEIRKYDNPYCSINKKNNNELKELNVEDCISISNIVITSFDKNISLRTTV